MAPPRDDRGRVRSPYRAHRTEPNSCRALSPRHQHSQLTAADIINTEGYRLRLAHVILDRCSRIKRIRVVLRLMHLFGHLFSRFGGDRAGPPSSTGIDTPLRDSECNRVPC